MAPRRAAPLLQIHSAQHLECPCLCSSAGISSSRRPSLQWSSASHAPGRGSVFVPDSVSSQPRPSCSTPAFNAQESWTSSSLDLLASRAPIPSAQPQPATSQYPCPPSMSRLMHRVLDKSPKLVDSTHVTRV